MTGGVRRRWNDCEDILPPPESLFRDLDQYHAVEAEKAKTGGAKGPKRSRGKGSAKAVVARVRPLDGKEVSPAKPGGFERYARTALAEEVEAVASAIEGDRNKQLNLSSFNVGSLVG